MERSGVINIYKEAGYTSHDVVAKLRGILKQKKIGHTGTLDPQAQGVLPVCLGKGTKLCDLLADHDKEYEAVLRLGITTDTQDMEGNVLQESSVQVSEKEVRTCILSFQGEQMQVPPMYSALKVNGKKLYELAREGKVVERKARPVTFHKIEVLWMELPKVKIRVQCSKGTYIRTLCNDIGEKLGCGGCMEELLRTRVERFALEDAVKLDEVQKAMEEGTVDSLIFPVDRIFDQYPTAKTTTQGDLLVHNGNRLFSELLQEEPEAESGYVRVYDSEDTFIGLFEKKTDQLVPVKMFYRKEN
ncbi:tRNA pseudouridine(55) synthase TruB [Blautia faecicola]|uniref:tRNA pseudouridine synthase B n=1 Tax=Blautia faecicola TaxID=2509240 RepID=A0A4Q1RIC8_9FIRM|nr:tRNA pseudouridine(55) synthase TruB [Blautia faecicola]RXS75481.1 tRNA pseudouridine(55) synthase TruB [Blautia faecicola]